MKIKEIIEEKMFLPNRKHFRGFVSLQKFRTTFLVVATIGLLCAGSFLYGSNSQNADIKVLIKELNSIHAKLEDSAERRLTKRDLFNLDPIGRLHHVMKRNPQDRVQQSTAVTQSKVAGITYTRWGRRSCPNNKQTSLIYEGAGAGSHYQHSGGGSNVLCTPYDFTYKPGKYVDGHQGSSYLYGMEYRDAAWADTLFNVSLIEGGDFRLHDIPCAVCMTHGRVTQLMIPAVDECPNGWTKEYSGYILSSAHSHSHSSQYLCVDDTPEVVPGSQGDQGGDLYYIVEATCPSMQCEPFVAGRELRCVVCTK